MSEDCLGYACYKCKRIFRNQPPRTDETGHVFCIVCNDSMLELILNEEHIEQLRGDFPQNRAAQDQLESSSSSSTLSRIRLPPPPTLSAGSTLEVTYRVVDPNGVRSGVTQVEVGESRDANSILRRLHTTGTRPTAPLRMPTSTLPPMAEEDAGVGESSSSHQLQPYQPRRGINHEDNSFMNPSGAGSRPPSLLESMLQNRHATAARPRNTFQETTPRPQAGGAPIVDPMHLIFRSMFRSMTGNTDGNDEQFQRIQTQLLQLAGHSSGPTPTEVLSQLPRVSGGITEAMKAHDPAYNRGCSICQEDYDDESPSVTHLTCGHYYHSECIEHWLTSSQTCPDCRAVVTAPPQTNDEE